MSSEDLNERDFECWYLSMHKDACQVQLHLKADVDISPVDGRGPPESETTVGDLVETTALSMSQLLVLHRLLKSRGFLPEETLPRWKVGALEECVLQNALDSAQSLDHVSAIVVEVPELSIVTLMSPPEWILFQHLQ